MIRREDFLSVIAMAAFLTVSVAYADEKPEKNIPYHTVGVGDFQSFVKNWNAGKHPVLYAFIQSSAQWNEIFHPAPVMGGERNLPFAPDDKQFEREQLLISARVMFPSKKMFSKVQTIFQVEKVTMSDKELIFSYRFEEPKTHESFTVKSYIGVWVPKHNYQKVRFIENEKPIGTLELSKGQWRFPDGVTSRDGS